MIQRIQTIYLILGIGLAIAFWFVPFGYAPVLDTETHQSALQAMKGIDFIGLIIPNAVSILLMLITVFTYTNYKVQKTFGLLAGLSIVTTIGVVAYAVLSPYVDSDPYVTVATVWGGGGLFLIAALIADIAAYNYICKDHKLIRSYDRIR